MKNSTEIKSDEITQVLHSDHVKVNELFFNYTQTDEDSEKQKIVKQITLELGLHSKAEEEVAYAALRDGDNEENEDMVDEADTEHHVVEFLLAELGNMKPADSHYDAKVTVLWEVVKHHVEEEETEMFDRLKSSDKNLQELGERFIARKEELAKEPLPEVIFPVAGTKLNSRKSQ